jgi:GntP family gluconate:H+ symporter
MTRDARLLILVALALAGLVLLIARLRVPAFIALALAALAVGLGAGLDPALVSKTFCDGVGAALGTIAMALALGAVLGKLLAVSGGAARLATSLLGRCSGSWTPWGVALVAFVVGLPVFFGVGVVLLIPMVVTLAGRTQAPILRYGLPLVASLSAAHGLTPPHPGPIAAVELLGANPGRTLVYALVIGLPVALLAGPILGPWLARGLRVEPGALTPAAAAAPAARAPGVGSAWITLLLPVALMLLATAADLTLAADRPLRRWADLAGHPVTALLAAVVVGYAAFGPGSGLGLRELGRLSEECLAPVATVMLAIGAGGGFSRVLVQSGAGDAIAAFARGSGVPPLILGWVVAVAIRVATGSATVAITTAAGLLAPVAAATPGLSRELLVVALGGGSLACSHVNDGGFWLVKEYLNLSVAQTFRTWSVIETAIAVLVLALTLFLSWIL